MEPITQLGTKIQIESSFIDSETISYKFSFPISENYITITYYQNKYEAHMENTFIDPSNIKIFCIILRHTIDFLTEIGCKKLAQLVTQDDWDQILCYDKWEINNIVNSIDSAIYYHIECDINDALFNIGKGLGLNIKET